MLRYKETEGEQELGTPLRVNVQNTVGVLKQDVRAIMAAEGVEGAAEAPVRMIEVSKLRNGAVALLHSIDEFSDDSLVNQHENSLAHLSTWMLVSDEKLYAQLLELKGEDKIVISLRVRAFTKEYPPLLCMQSLPVSELLQKLEVTTGVEASKMKLTLV